MGSIMGKAMDENLKKTQQFMLQTQKMQMERQMQMQDMMREKQMSMQLARAREMFNWWATFYVVATLGMLKGYSRSHHPAAIAPFLPLTFIVAYQADLAYGSKMDRIRVDAEHLIQEQGTMLNLPYGMPTMDDIDAKRAARQ